MLTSNPVASAAFVMVSSLVLLVSLLVGGRRTRLSERLRDLSGQEGLATDTITLGKIASTTLPRMGTPFIPSDEEERTKLQTRLIHAGLYRRQAMVVFLGVKASLMIAPAFLGVAASLMGVVTLRQGLIIGGCLGIVGLIGPSFWLDHMKGKRQSNFRRALPDALDVLVICLEGGLSLSAGLRRVSAELRTAHPALAAELAIVQREVQLGLTSGEALRKMGERSDLEEVREPGLGHSPVGAVGGESGQVTPGPLGVSPAQAVSARRGKGRGGGDQGTLPHALVHLAGRFRRDPGAGGLPPHRDVREDESEALRSGFL